MVLIYKLIIWTIDCCATWYKRREALATSKKGMYPEKITDMEDQLQNIVFTSPLIHNNDSKGTLCNSLDTTYDFNLQYGNGNDDSQLAENTTTRFSFPQCASTPNADMQAGQDVTYAEVLMAPKAKSLGDINVQRGVNSTVHNKKDRSVTDINLTLTDGWRIEKYGKCRLLLLKDRSCEELTWDDYKGSVYNTSGYEVSTKPPPSVVRRYKCELSRMTYPEKQLINGTWTLPDYPGVIWEGGIYLDTTMDNRPVHGFKDDLFLTRRSLNNMDAIERA
jgi:hypothetical protein